MPDRAEPWAARSVQSYGVLFAFDRASTIVAAVSDNVEGLLGRKVENVLGRAIGDVVPELREPAGASREGLADSDRSLFRVTIEVAGELRDFNAAVHYNGTYTILEIERMPAAPRPKEWYRSRSVMLEARSAFKRLCEARSITELCDMMVEELRNISEYDRTMVYRFAEDGSAEVISEARSPGLPPFLGLRFPESEYPTYVRELFLAQSIRYIADVDAPLAAIVPPVMPKTGLPLDLSSAFLRSPGTIHVEHLRSMGVVSALLMSLVKDGELWGLLVAHNSVARPSAAAKRGVCDFLGMLGSSLLGGAAELELLKAREAAHDTQEQLVAQLSRGSDIAHALAGCEVTLGDLVASDGFAIGEPNGAIRTFGAAPSAEHIARIVHEIASERPGAVASSECIGQTWPALATLDVHPVSGILFAPVLEGAAGYVAWFRNERNHSVNWAGDPRGARTAAAAAPQPRIFTHWTEEVRDRSDPWSAADREAAGIVREHLGAALLRLAQDQLARLANYDALTGLANRRFVHSELDRLAQSQESVALIYIDLDRFKRVNDGLGHDAGDDFLVMVAARLNAAARPGDIVARFGGDEFVVLCHDCPPSAAARLAERIVRIFDAPFIVGIAEVTGTASVGWAVAKSRGDTGELIRRADLAMYYAKRRGGNQAARSTSFERRRRKLATKATMGNAV